MPPAPVGVTAAVPASYGVGVRIASRPWAARAWGRGGRCAGFRSYPFSGELGLRGRATGIDPPQTPKARVLLGFCQKCRHLGYNAASEGMLQAAPNWPDAPCRAQNSYLCRAQFPFAAVGRNKNASETIAENISITEALSDGKGLGRLPDGQVVMVEGAVPGDVVNALLIKRQKGTWMARLHHLYSPSPHRVPPHCAHFGTCGGCKWQHLDYTEQLKWKQYQTEDALQRIGGLTLPEPQPILGCESAYGYRNKVEFTFSTQRWLTFDELRSGQQFPPETLGFHAPGHFDRVLQVDECHIADPVINAIRNALLEFSREQNIPFYDLKGQTGFLRNLVFRTSRATGERMLILIVKEDNRPFIELIFNNLSARFPEITEWLYCINGKQNDAFSDQPVYVWRGQGFITERLGDFNFRIGPVSFFQTNTPQAERLYTVVRDWLPEGINTLYDLYCGTGSIGIFCSTKAQRIVGVEYVPESVADARVNANLNGITNATFHAGDMGKLLTPQFVAENGIPDAVITDPPRNGMDQAVVRQLLAMAPPVIIYVSCKPSTQARDVVMISEKYRVARWQPVDMFPHTSHTENVLLLERI